MKRWTEWQVTYLELYQSRWRRVNEPYGDDEYRARDVASRTRGADVKDVRLQSREVQAVTDWADEGMQG